MRSYTSQRGRTYTLNERELCVYMKQIISMGRQSGKSILSQMMGDMGLLPVERLICTEGRVYGDRYYCVEPVGGSWLEMERWAMSVYGLPGSVWNVVGAEAPSIAHRYYMNARKFWFRSEADRSLFLLKWG